MSKEVLLVACRRKRYVGMMEFKEDRVVITGFCNYKGIKIFLFLNVIKIRDKLRDLEKLTLPCSSKIGKNAKIKLGS